MEAYSGFAGVYDLLMDDFDYPSWAEYYLELLARAGVRPASLCDCACGTGSMSVQFAQRDLRVTGVDISREMLELAAKKARQSGVSVQLACQDMTRLALPKPVDALVCACDGVNYLTTDGRALAFFRAAHRAIRPGGALAFDVSSAHKLRDVLGNSFFGEERDEVAYLWQNVLEEDIVTMDITFFLREGNGLYRRVAETHRQRIYAPEQLKELLEQAGFSQVQIYGDRNFAPPGGEDLRVHICATRE